MTNNSNSLLKRKKFLSASGLARRLDISVGTLLRRIELGQLVPDGFSGNSFLIAENRLESIREKFFTKPQINA